MIDKQVASPAEAVADIYDGATVMIGGFGEAGSPIELIHALIDQGAKDLTVVNNNTGSGEVGLAALIKAERVGKMICSFPAHGELDRLPRALPAADGSSSSSSRRARSPSASGPAAPASRPSTRRPSVGTPLEEGKETPRLRRPGLRDGARAQGRLRAGQVQHGRPLRQPGLQQDRAQLRPIMCTAGSDHDRAGAQIVVDRGEHRSRSRRHAGHLRRPRRRGPSPLHESDSSPKGVTYP